MLLHEIKHDNGMFGMRWNSTKMLVHLHLNIVYNSMELCRILKEKSTERLAEYFRLW